MPPASKVQEFPERASLRPEMVNMILIDWIMLLSDVEQLSSTFHNGVRSDIVDLFSAEIYAVPIASPDPLHPLVVDRVPHI